MNSKPETIYAADLFSGCGGATSALIAAAREMGANVELVAVNHWQTAVDTHKANYPGFVHYCQKVGKVDPSEAVPGGYLDILLAGPECTHHSKARGGKPKNKQSRASAFDIIWWLESLDVRNVLIENVEEFAEWGPLDEENRPIPAFKGYYFRLFCETLRELGYAVEYRVLCAADFGDPTTRRRLFLMATRGGSPRWPSPSHRPAKSAAQFPGTKPWVPAREVIDLSIKGTSIYSRSAVGKKDLVPNTLKRIFAGIRKYSLVPFLVPQFGEQGPRSLDNPINTLTTESRGVGFCQPYLVILRNHCSTTPLDQPLPTLCTEDHVCLAEPFLMNTHHSTEGDDRRCYDLQRPLVTQTAKQGMALIEPFFVGSGGPTGMGEPRPTSVPFHTLLTENHTGIVEPFLYYGYGGKDAASPAAPLPTVCASWEHLGYVEPFLVRYNGPKGKGEERVQPLTAPISTLDTSNRFALCQFVISYYGNGECALSLADPLDTVTTRDRFGLVQLEIVTTPDGQEAYEGRVIGWLDILFRMLQPHELALAHSFPRSFVFTGNKSAQIKMIGNSWPILTGKALCLALLSNSRSRRDDWSRGDSPSFAHSHRAFVRRVNKLLDEPAALYSQDLFNTEEI